MPHSFIEKIYTLLDTLPPLEQENTLFYVLNAIIFLIVFHAIKMILFLTLNKQLGLTTKPYSSENLAERKILILGDSTAVGTGASSPEDTIAGRLAHDFPHSQVINLAKNGGLIRDLRTQIDRVKNETFDMIIISAGGNDVWHYSSLSKMRTILEGVLADANTISNHRVIFLLYNNIGSAPIFPAFIQFFLKRRCIRVQQLIKFVATRSRVPTIELFTEEAHNPFLKNPKELFASDGIHPSSRGYALWYHRMWREMVNNGFHYE